MPRPRSTKSLIPPWLEHSPQPAILLNGEGRIAAINAAGNQWLGLAHESWKNRLPHPGHLHSPDPVDRRLAGLAIDLPAVPAISRQTVFATPGDAAAGFRTATVTRLGQAPGSPAWTLIVVDEAETDTPEATEPNPHDLSQARAAVARMVRDSRKSGPVFSLVGKSAEADILRAQVTAAESAHSHWMITGPSGSEKETLAHLIHKHRHQRSVMPPPLTVIQSRMADLGMVQDTLRQALQDRRTFDPPQACLLLVDLNWLEPAAQAELVSRLRNAAGQLTLAATCTPHSEGTFRAGGSGKPATAPPPGIDPFLMGQLGAQNIVLPALQNRRSDLVAIATGVLDAAARQLQRPPTRLSPAVLEWIVEYPWPGDLNELKSVLTSALRESTSTQIETGDLPQNIRMAVAALRGTRLPVERILLDDFLAQVERELLSRALAQAKYNRSQAARLVGITRPRFLRRCEQLGIALPHDSPEFEPIDFEEAPE